MSNSSPKIPKKIALWNFFWTMMEIYSGSRKNRKKKGHNGIMVKDTNTLLKYLFTVFLLLIISCFVRNVDNKLRNQLEINYSGKNAQIEVGGPYVGIEMHNSSPLLNRISLFYPVANSIDLSMDYWKREKYRVMFLGLKVGEGPKEWIGLEPYKYRLTPYSVTFQKNEEDKSIEIAYDFCKDKPSMVARFEIKNTSKDTKLFEVYTHLELSIRTSHTYEIKDKAWTEYDEGTGTIYVNYDDIETDNVQIFVANAGEEPEYFTTKSKIAGTPGTSENHWMDKSSELNGELLSQDDKGIPLAAFVYKKNLSPGEKITITQIIGSCEFGEGREIVSYLLDNYKKEITLYEDYVLKKAYKEGTIETGDKSIDHSVNWAKAILATNAHYLDNNIVPMPCPAEYNFYFTHDVLLSDLGAVYFDPLRVKKDLEYIIHHANADNIIPHAYYWKDKSYVTEYAGSDNWNHFHFIILSGRYLRHSKDVKTLLEIYPYLSKSVEVVLINKGEDDLIWAYRPDWWDIGRSFGPRSYMTILCIRALREYIYISSILKKNLNKMMEYENLTYKMQQQLTERLWSEDLNYLINYYENGTLDPHIYIGSLLAAHFNLIDIEKKIKLVNTASENLLDEKIGIYNVFPMDFHKLVDFLKFSGNEAGEPFIYANGGIWPHGNAWYALSLISIGEYDEALNFIKNTMTIEGIINSPNGHPAMYEYRNSNYKDSVMYGKIDKPQFLWAAGWYLYSIYNLFGVRENEWNIYFEPYVFKNRNKYKYELCINGRSIVVNVKGKGEYFQSIKYDRKFYPTAIIFDEMNIKERIDFVLGTPKLPYISYSNSILNSCEFSEDEKTLMAILRAFNGHRGKVKIISPLKPENIILNGVELTDNCYLERKDEIYKLDIDFSHKLDTDTLFVKF